MCNQFQGWTLLSFLSRQLLFELGLAPDWMQQSSSGPWRWCPPCPWSSPCASCTQTSADFLRLVFVLDSEAVGTAAVEAVGTATVVVAVVEVVVVQVGLL